MSINGLVALCGFGLGIVFGAIVQRTNFCTMGGISDGILMGNWNRFRAWMLAIAIAIIGTQALQMTGVINLSKSIYQTANFGWAGAIIGGLMFGFGMVLGGGCGNRTVVRFGAGNLKSLVVLLMLGLFAYMTLRGLIALARVELEGATNVDLRSAGLATQGIPDIVSAVLGVSMAVIRPVIAAIAAVALLVFCFKSAAFRTSGRDIAAGLVIGAVVIGGWYITGVIGHDEFEPTRLESVTFVAPVGQSLQYLMTFTGSKINFGIAVVGGVIAGAFLMAKLRGEFRIEAFGGAADMLRHLVGGALMGTGGVLALGCTIGQGITGNSTLALGSLIAILSIIAGGVLGIRYLEEGSLGGAVKAVFARG